MTDNICAYQIKAPFHCISSCREPEVRLRMFQFANNWLHRQQHSCVNRLLQSWICCGDGDRRCCRRCICKALLKIRATFCESIQHCCDCYSCSCILQRLARFSLPPLSSLKLAGHTTSCATASTVLFLTTSHFFNPGPEAVALPPKCLQIISLQFYPGGVHAAGATQFSSGVPEHMHRYMALYSIVLFLVAVAAPMEQFNNAAMYAEVSQNDVPPDCCFYPQQL